MPLNKRAAVPCHSGRVLLFWLLFFLLAFSPEAQENSAAALQEISVSVFAQTGTLWVEDGGASGYWNSGLAFNVNRQVSLGFNFGQIYSNLPWLEGSVFHLAGSFGINVQGAGLYVNAGFFEHQNIELTFDNKSFLNDGGRGGFISLELPIHFGFIKFVPSFFSGTASWDNGDLYWFFGKPELPSFFIYGFDVLLNQNEIYGHKFTFRRLSLSAKLITNESKDVFGAQLDGNLFLYQFSLEKPSVYFSASLGWLYGGVLIEGVMDSANQPYFLFPYLFNRVNAGVKVNAGFAMLNILHEFSIFRLEIDLGALHIFNGNGNIYNHYKMKNLFGGSESEEYNPLDISGFGMAFLFFRASLPALPVFNNQKLSFGLQKALALPWGYENSSGTASGEFDFLSTVRTALFSGFSIYASLAW